MSSYGLFITCSSAFEDQKHVGQPSVCVRARAHARADTGVSDSVASSDKSPAGSTSLWEEGKPQQCGPGGRGRLERAGWWEKCWKIHERERARGAPDHRQDAELCGILCCKQRSACIGVAGKEPQSGLHRYRGLGCCLALTQGLVGSHCNCIQCSGWSMGSRLAENTTKNSTIRRKMMVFFLATLISWGAAAIVTSRLHMCKRIKAFFFLLQFMDCRAPISSSYTLKIK